MATPKVLVLRSPGTNCDEETGYAFDLVGGKAESQHVQALQDDSSLLERFQVLCIPGGFSFGDDLGAGRILASKLRHILAEELKQFVTDGKLVLGICNGFQVLLQSGLLVETGAEGPRASLSWNRGGRYEDRWVRLARDGEQCIFLQGIDSMELPIAHAEGRFVTGDDGVLEELAQGGQLALRYISRESQLPVSDEVLPFPANPNGAQRNVAGICDPTGRVFGLMPHPERFLEPTQHPAWTRRESSTGGDGVKIFENAIEFFR